MVRNLNSTKHVYKAIDSSTFNNVSHDFYNKCQRDLERLGFDKICDIEDVTLRGLKFTRPTFIRIMGNPSLKINAGIYHSNTNFLMKVMFFFKKFRFKIYEFNTHFSNDIILETTIASPSIQNIDIPSFIRQYCNTISIRELFEKHKKKQDEIILRNKGIQIRYVDSLDAFIDNENRSFEIKWEKYRQEGWVSKEYLYKQVGKNKEMVDQIFVEIQNILADEKSHNS
jgi:hypothetical protein